MKIDKWRTIDEIKDAYTRMQLLDVFQKEVTVLRLTLDSAELVESVKNREFIVPQPQGPAEQLCAAMLRVLHTLDYEGDLVVGGTFQRTEAVQLRLGLIARDRASRNHIDCVTVTTPQGERVMFQVAGMYDIDAHEMASWMCRLGNAACVFAPRKVRRLTAAELVMRGVVVNKSYVKRDVLLRTTLSLGGGIAYILGGATPDSLSLNIGCSPSMAQCICDSILYLNY